MFQFNCEDSNIEYTDNYRYLGLILNEYLDYSVTAKYVAQSAARALGLLISKFKQAGGMPFDVLKMLCDKQNMVNNKLRGSYMGSERVRCD